MNLVNLEEAKLYISYDSDVMDSEIKRQVNAIEGYLFNATGIDWGKIDEDSLETSDTAKASKAVAKDYVLFRLRCDYYNDHTEMNDKRLSFLINQLKVAALMV